MPTAFHLHSPHLIALQLHPHPSTISPNFNPSTIEDPLLYSMIRDPRPCILHTPPSSSSPPHHPHSSPPSVPPHLPSNNPRLLLSQTSDTSAPGTTVYGGRQKCQGLGTSSLMIINFSNAECQFCDMYRRDISSPPFQSPLRWPS
jgi:hypothetical protein